jgi:hypothetical protein
VAEATSSNMDFTKVLSRLSGKQLLIGILLFVVWAVLLTWMGVAQTSLERIVAGSLMGLILAGVLLSVGRLSSIESTTPSGPQGKNLQAGQNPATPREIEAPPADMIAGPDRSYLIRKPPDDWVMQEMTMAEWILDAQDIAVRPQVSPPPVDTIRNIQVFRSPRKISIIPKPGQTKIDGRALPTALEVPVRVKLSILLLDRAQPPLFIERTLENNFVSVVGTAATALPFRLGQLSSGTLPGSGLPFRLAQFEQKLDDVLVNGKPGEAIEIRVVYLGIEGEIRDYLLVMNYAVQSSPSPESLKDLEILESLANSFRPLKTVNPAQTRQQMQSEADTRFKDLVRDQGQQFFFAEFAILLNRLGALDLDDPADRLRAMQMVTPFESFAAQVGLHGEEWPNFWDSLHAAQKGDASGFKQLVTQAITEMNAQDQDTQARQQPA